MLPRRGAPRRARYLTLSTNLPEPAAMAQPPRPDQTRIAAVRRFNRFYTRQIGVLRETISTAPTRSARCACSTSWRKRDAAPTASDIGRALDLDAGYLSRVLRNFEKRGLIARKTVRRTTRGRAISRSPRAAARLFAPLEQRSQDMSAPCSASSSAGEQARLVAAMQTIETLLGDDARAGNARYSLRAPRPAISAGSSPATPSSTRRNTAGASRSRACARRSSPTSSTTTTPSASAAGSPRSTARMSAASCW